MISQLELRFKPDSDGMGELFASASGGYFSGAGEAWFSAKEIQSFGERLQSCFPLAPDTELRLEGGYWEPGRSPAKLEEVLLGIRIYPVGTTGQIGVHLDLAEGVHQEQRPESRARASFELMASYEDLHRFGAQFQSMLTSSSATACLYPCES